MTLDIDGNNPFQTNLILPLAVDGLFVDARRLPIALNTAVAIPPNAVITVRHKGVTVAIRLLYFETYAGSQPPIQDAVKVTPLTWSDAAYGPGVGKQQYSLTWIVDADSIHAGNGRLVLHHKHRGDPSLLSYRSAWAMLGGETAKDLNWLTMITAMKLMTVTNTITNTPAWDPATQTLDHNSQGSSLPRSASHWKVTAQLGPVTLAVERDDVYDANRNNVNYQQPATGAPFLPPFYVDPATLSRTVNGQPMQQWSSTEKSFRVSKIDPANIFRPYT
jgi:hypothetical protein